MVKRVIQHYSVEVSPLPRHRKPSDQSILDSSRSEVELGCFQWQILRCCRFEWHTANKADFGGFVVTFHWIRTRSLLGLFCRSSLRSARWSQSATAKKKKTKRNETIKSMQRVAFMVLYNLVKSVSSVSIVRSESLLWPTKWVSSVVAFTFCFTAACPISEHRQCA